MLFEALEEFPIFCYLYMSFPIRRDTWILAHQQYVIRLPSNTCNRSCGLSDFPLVREPAGDFGEWTVILFPGGNS